MASLSEEMHCYYINTAGGQPLLISPLNRLLRTANNNTADNWLLSLLCRWKSHDSIH